jgi:hypothetical protein
MRTLAVILTIAVTPAAAADLPILIKRVQAEQRAAIANQERHKRMTRKQFENMLLSPIGRGRLE